MTTRLPIRRRSSAELFGGQLLWTCVTSAYWCTQRAATLDLCDICILVYTETMLDDSSADISCIQQEQKQPQDIVIVVVIFPISAWVGPAHRPTLLPGQIWQKETQSGIFCVV